MSCTSKSEKFLLSVSTLTGSVSHEITMTNLIADLTVHRTPFFLTFKVPANCCLLKLSAAILLTLFDYGSTLFGKENNIKCIILNQNYHPNFGMNY